MNYSTYLTLLMATLAPTPLPADLANPGPAPPPLDDALAAASQQILDLVEQFRAATVTPEATPHFEQQSQLQLRELGRSVARHAYNCLEPAPSPGT